MVVIWLIVVIALGISLYNYFDSKDMNQLTSAVHNNLVFDHRNKRYGAYSMRKTYNSVMLTIIGAVVALFGLTFGTQYSFGSRGELPSIMKASEMDDTTLLSLYEPPKDEVKLPPSYSVKSDRGSGGQNAADQEAQETSSSESSNPDERNSTNSEKPPKPKVRSSNEEINSDADHFDKTSADIKKRYEEGKAKREKQRQDAMRKSGNDVKGSQGKQGSVPETKEAADFDLDGRTPFNNDNWYLQYPTYTCQNGGTITLRIKVDDGGYVRFVEPITTGVDPCVLENAKKYAKKARFNASTKPMQEGTITYKFKAQ
ncbi:MAG TPA: hypothetical protein VK151_00680 [Fluviicola sp.]|nr:hypothetical protein [Fluviicola sp.]